MNDLIFKRSQRRAFCNSPSDVIVLIVRTPQHASGICVICLNLLNYTNSVSSCCCCIFAVFTLKTKKYLVLFIYFLLIHNYYYIYIHHNVVVDKTLAFWHMNVNISCRTVKLKYCNSVGGNQNLEMSNPQ